MTRIRILFFLIRVIRVDPWLKIPICSISLSKLEITLTLQIIGG